MRRYHHLVATTTERGPERPIKQTDCPQNARARPMGLIYVVLRVIRAYKSPLGL